MKVKFADFHQVTRSRSFPTAITWRDLLRRESVELVRTLLPTSKGVRLLGVTVSNFDRASADANDELPLFGDHFCRNRVSASGLWPMKSGPGARIEGGLGTR